MMKNLKNGFGLVVVLMLLMWLMPVGAFAEESIAAGETTSQQVNTEVQISIKKPVQEMVDSSGEIEPETTFDDAQTIILSGTGDNYPEPWRSGGGTPYYANGIWQFNYDSWGYAVQNCTSWVAWALHDRNGFEIPRAIGNASDWGIWARNNGYAVDGIPKIGSVAWWSSNHVAWVKSVNSDGTVTIEEYNYNWNGAYNCRNIPINSTQYQYIHFKDMDTNPPDTSNNRIGALTNSGDYYVKEGGLDAAWVGEFTGAKQVMLTGNRIGVLGANGDFYVKEGGVDASWVKELTGVKQGILSGNRIGALTENGDFYVKEGGLDAAWVMEYTGVKQGMLSGNRIGVLGTGGDFFVKEGGLDGLWVLEYTGAKQGLLSGDRIGVLETSGEFYVKEGGLDAPWVKELTDVKQGALLDSNDSNLVDDTIPLSGINLNKNNLNLGTGNSENLIVSYTPNNTTDNKNITWSSSDSSVATVDGSGKINALKVGSSKITATVGSLKAECLVNVNSLNDNKEKIGCIYQTQIENIGWQGWKNSGEMCGTSGQGLRLEGIEIKLDKQDYDLGVAYSTHVQNFGWQDLVSDGIMSGTSGKGLRLEAIKINLTGTDSDKFDIYYQVHAQNFGWLDWAKNGTESGTAGCGYRLEGIRIVILPKNDPAPGSTERPFVQI